MLPNYSSLFGFFKVQRLPQMNTRTDFNVDLASFLLNSILVFFL